MYQLNPIIIISANYLSNSWKSQLYKLFLSKQLHLHPTFSASLPTVSISLSSVHCLIVSISF